jgi:hypothetical protein
MHHGTSPRRTVTPPDEYALNQFDGDAIAQQHSTVVLGIADYFQPGPAMDNLVRDSLELIPT